MSNGSILYPNVTSLQGLQGQSGPGQTERKRPDGAPSEFDHALQKAKDLGSTPQNGLQHVRAPLKFSSHAAQRLRDRKIALDPATMAKLSEAIDKADSKGVQDTLVLTQDAALIVNVKNRTVVTAMDKNSLNGNVFTHIDGAVLI